MSRYPLHDLHDTEFEELVVLICRKLLGAGVTSFCAGPDGGKDAKFEGKAEMFPSNAEPASGKFIIQAKHTTNSVALCSASEFKTKIVENHECPKIKRQFDNNLLTHYIIFTNRKKSGSAEDIIPNLIREKTGVEHVWLRGFEDIQQDLMSNPNIVKMSGLDKLRSPIQFFPDDMRDVINAFYLHRNSVGAAFGNGGQYDYQDYPGILQKNVINGLSETYYHECIEGGSGRHFWKIRDFLTNPRNLELSEQYQAVADELKCQMITHRDRFLTFDEVLEEVYNLISERSTELQIASRRPLIRVFVHYMYANCDLGAKRYDSTC